MKTTQAAQYLDLGVISDGTLRAEDVGEALADALRPLRLSRADRALVREWDRLDTNADDDSVEAVDDLVGELEDAVERYCPPYAYYGASEGDGACFGVWAITDDDSLPRYDVGESPHNSGDCYEVSDHGNVSCGYRDRRGVWHEYWSVV